LVRVATQCANPGDDDGSGEPLQIAAKAPSDGLQTRKPAQVAFGDPSQDAASVGGPINDQAREFARQLGCRSLDPAR
jgi:hypothetical protein